MKSEKRGYNAERPVVDALDAVFFGVGWPVYESYSIGPESSDKGGPATLTWAGPVVGYARPLADPGLPDGLAALAGADDASFLAWAHQRGGFGPQLGSPYRESMAVIREEVEHLARTRRLLTVLRERPTDDDELREAARAAAGHLVDAGLIAKYTPIRFVRGDGQLRDGARADIQALNALGTAIGVGLRRRVLVDGHVTGNSQEMRLQGGLVATTPLAAAFLRTLAEAAMLRISLREGARRLEWRQPRPCQRCGTVFAPTREAQRWCSKQCRWAASKAGGAS